MGWRVIATSLILAACWTQENPNYGKIKPLADAMISGFCPAQASCDYRAAWSEDRYTFKSLRQIEPGTFPPVYNCYTWTFENGESLAISVSEDTGDWQSVTLPNDRKGLPEFEPIRQDMIPGLVNQVSLVTLHQRLELSLTEFDRIELTSPTFTLQASVIHRGFHSTEKYRVSIDAQTRRLLSFSRSERVDRLDWSSVQVPDTEPSDALGTLTSIAYRNWPSGLHYTVKGPIYGRPNGSIAPVDPNFPITPPIRGETRITVEELDRRTRVRAPYLNDPKAHPYYLIIAYTSEEANDKTWFGELWVRADTLAPVVWSDKPAISEMFGMP
ncbi:MAG: hypothetical protein KF812_06845 [Fimbriimonadaceae bacterium]|nr:hypothetical protein [Fimbriimonadaceae bacterium]